MNKTQLLNALFVTLLLSLGSAVYATPIRQAQDLFRSAGTFTLDFNTLPAGIREPVQELSFMQSRSNLQGWKT